MKMNTNLRCGTAPFASLLAAALLGLAGRTAAQDEQVDLDAIWSDPIFQKQFVAGYGVNAEVEPRVSPEEIAVLEKLRPLMPTPPRAEEALRKQMEALAKQSKGGDYSAILDLTLAQLLFQQSKLDEALESYRRAVTKFPSFRRAWHDIGLINVRKGEYEAGINAFTRMIELGGGDAFSYGLLGYAHSAREDFQPAEAAYRTALLLQPENTEWRLGLTRCVFRQEKFEDAAALLDVLIARYPDKADFWMLQARTFLGMKQPLKAAENLESLDRLGLATLDSLNLLGDIYVTEDLPDLAARAYMRALDLDAAQALDKPLRSAETLAARGAMPQARQLIDHIREVAGDKLVEADRRKLLKLDARLSMQGGSGTDETAKVLEELVALDPLDGDALIMLGQYHSRLGEPDRAIFYFERAESIEAFEVNARIHHAQVLVGMGRYGDALPLLRRAQELRPREEVARYLEQVERISKAKR